MHLNCKSLPQYKETGRLFKGLRQLHDRHGPGFHYKCMGSWRDCVLNFILLAFHDLLCTYYVEETCWFFDREVLNRQDDWWVTSLGKPLKERTSVAHTYQYLLTPLQKTKRNKHRLCSKSAIGFEQKTSASIQRSPVCMNTNYELEKQKVI